MSGCRGPAYIEHTAVTTEGAPSLQVLGELPKDLMPDFDAEVDLRITEAQKRKGDDRTAVKGAESHQKTPGFMSSLLRNAVTTVVNKAASHAAGQETPTRDEQKRLDKPPQGGFTDVGLHTGGKNRHTTWPLVCAVLYVSAVCECRW
jgi:hypothetical protein